MNNQQDAHLKNIVGKDDTLAEARKLLSLARAKTGPGSGRSLGANVSGLPYICAFLASEKLGNGDVQETVAQKSSCLAPKNFAAALATVRTALGDSLRNKSSRKAMTYRMLCREHACAISLEDATYWMDEVEKVLLEECGVELEELLDEETRNAVLKCAVYRYTCTALKIPSPRQTTLSSEHSVHSRDLQHVTKFLEEKCSDIRDDMQKSSQGGMRSGRSSPMKLSPVKQATSESLLKRKLSSSSITATAKRTKAGSPTKTKEREEEAGSLPPVALVRPLTRSASTSALPVKQSAMRQAKASSSSKLLDDDGEEEEDTPSRRTSSRISNRRSSITTTPDNSPTKVPAQRMARLSLSKQDTSPSKTKGKGKAKEVDINADTPTPKRRGRPPQIKGRAQRTPSPAPEVAPEEGDGLRDEEQEETEDIEERLEPTCRYHRRPAYLDRRFFSPNYDLRVSRTREACEKHFDELVAKFGLPFNL